VVKYLKKVYDKLELIKEVGQELTQNENEVVGMKKRRFILFLILVIIIVAFTACDKSKDKKSSKSKEKDGDTEEVEKKTYKFTIWGSKEDLSEKKGSWLKTRCDMFAAKYPNDEVIFEFVSCDIEKMLEKLQENRDTAPDIFIFSSTQINELVEDRLLTRLWGETEEYVISSNTTSIAKLATFKEKVYGIPVSANPFVLYYDKRIFSREDMKSLDIILSKGVLSYPSEDTRYLQAFYEAQDVVKPPEETEDDTSETSQEPESTKQEDDAQQELDTMEPEILAPESVDLWLEKFRENPNVLQDVDGAAGMNGMQNGTVQAAVYDAAAYPKMKELMGENLGVAALPTFIIDGVEKQMKCVTEAQNIGVNPDCENFEMTIALATYLGSADSQQMRYDMSKAVPINLTAIQSLRNVDLPYVISQIADKENPGWDIPEEEKE